jgi:flagellin-like hook-associated protein FlgL
MNELGFSFLRTKQEQTQLTESESNILDAIMATAVTNLTQTETAQQVLVEAGGQISQLN